MKKLYITLGIIVILLIGGFYFLKGQSTQKSPPMIEKITMKSEGNMKGNTALSTRYINYTPDVLTKAEQSGGRTVIFFAAFAWCPYCQAADKDFKANFSKVPSDVTIVIANYDTETALKQKYNIVHQDGFVQVDKKGNPVTQWISGGQGVQALLDNIKPS